MASPSSAYKKAVEGLLIIIFKISGPDAPGPLCNLTETSNSLNYEVVFSIHARNGRTATVKLILRYAEYLILWFSFILTLQNRFVNVTKISTNQFLEAEVRLNYVPSGNLVILCQLQRSLVIRYHALSFFGPFVRAK